MTDFVTFVVFNLLQDDLAYLQRNQAGQYGGMYS